MRDRVSTLAAAHRSITIIVGWIIIATALPLLMLIPPFSTFQTQTLWIDGFTNAGVFILLALGLNIVVGFAGLLDLGYAAFFAIGAYTYAFARLADGSVDLPARPVLADAARRRGRRRDVRHPARRAHAAAARRLPRDRDARLRRDRAGRLPERRQASPTGTNGIGGVYKPDLLGYQFTLGNPVPYYVAMVAIIAVVMIFVYRLQDSRLGRAWMAVREDELAAASNGVNTVTTKLLAFALGASTAGLAGVFTASKLTLVSPDQFSFAVSFTILAMVVLGGMGNVWGVAVGAFILYTIQSVVLKQLNPFFHTLNVPFLKDIDFVQYQFLLYGLALVAHDAAETRGPLPEQSAAGASCTPSMDENVGDELGPDPSTSPMEEPMSATVAEPRDGD